MGVIISRGGSGSGGGDVFLANNQEFTGVNRFDSRVKLGLDSSTSGLLQFDTAAGGGFSQTIGTPIAGYTADRSITLPDIGGDLFLAGNNTKSTAADADAGKIARYNIAGLTTTVTAKKFTNATPAGMYVFMLQAVVTSIGSGSGALTVSYTTDGGARSVSLTLDMLTTASQQAVETLYLASGNVTWSVTGTFTGTYALRMRGTYLGA